MYSANVYSKATEGNKSVSTNFKVKEFACKDGSDVILINPGLVELLQAIRSKYGKTTINSAYRTVSYNKKIGGSTNSQHTQGNACDIVVAGHTPTEVAKLAEQLMPGFGGIIVYPTFTHVDVRNTRYRGVTKDGKTFNAVSRF